MTYHISYHRGIGQQEKSTTLSKFPNQCLQRSTVCLCVIFPLLLSEYYVNMRWMYVDVSERQCILGYCGWSLSFTGRLQYYVLFGIGHSLDSCHRSVKRQWNRLFSQTRTLQHVSHSPSQQHTHTRPSMQPCNICARCICRDISMINALQN